MGLVGGSLIASLSIGLIGVQVHPEVKQIFLLLYMFGAGYGAGPQFFRVLRADGVKPLVLTLTVCGTGVLMVWLAARIMHLGPGFSAGLLSGAMTQMSSMGVSGR
jgi:putative transport protein